MSEQIIRLTKTQKKITVNENGDFILVDVGNQLFVDGFLALYEKFSTKNVEIEEKAKQVEQLAEDTAAARFVKARAALALSVELCRSMCAEVDALFEDDVCLKVFGDIVPAPACFIEFFEQVTAIIGAAQGEQNKRMEKYTKKYLAGGNK